MKKGVVILYNYVIDYISTNTGNLISSSIFCVLGVLLGILCTPKDTNPSRDSGISIKQTKILIQQIISEQSVNHQSINKQYRQTNINRYPDNDSHLLGFFIGAVIIAAIYSKYHVFILNIFTGLTLMSFISAITIAIILHKNNNFDNLNKWWIVLMLIIVVIDLVALIFMSNQDVTIKGDLFLILKVLYYVLGFALVLIPNLFTFLLTIHLFSLNTFLARKGKVSYYIYRKTSIFTRSPKKLSIVLVAFSLVSLFFSSGTIYDFIESQNDSSTRSLFEIQSK